MILWVSNLKRHILHSVSWWLSLSWMTWTAGDDSMTGVRTAGTGAVKKFFCLTAKHVGSWFPDQRWNPRPGTGSSVLTTGLPGKSPQWLLYSHDCGLGWAGWRTGSTTVPMGVLTAWLKQGNWTSIWKLQTQKQVFHWARWNCMTFKVCLWKSPSITSTTLFVEVVTASSGLREGNKTPSPFFLFFPSLHDSCGISQFPDQGLNTGHGSESLES